MWFPRKTGPKTDGQSCVTIITVAKALEKASSCFNDCSKKDRRQVMKYNKRIFKDLPPKGLGIKEKVNYEM
jgi:hypothetical protein